MILWFVDKLILKNIGLPLHCSHSNFILSHKPQFDILHSVINMQMNNADLTIYNACKHSNFILSHKPQFDILHSVINMQMNNADLTIYNACKHTLKCPIFYKRPLLIPIYFYECPYFSLYICETLSEGIDESN